MQFDRKRFLPAVALAAAVMTTGYVSAQPGQGGPPPGQQGPGNQQRPPQQGNQRPPQNGQRPPQQGNQRPPQNGQRPPQQGNQRPPQNNQRPPQNNQRPPQGNAGRPNFQFDQNYRNQVAQHYRSDAMRYRNRKRPAFAPGYTIPRNYSIRPVPSSYWRGMPPPPAGYQYGYYDGYMVAYNPTTRIIADVMDLVTAFAH
ncbi:hypothetical protein [Terriglobus sp. ADX1]|uniref:hypothetical protein n=1 Tax=Terriglobus sp. ADX1 TaxID=2794063 RepID=UPI002FE5BD08